MYVAIRLLAVSLLLEKGRLVLARPRRLTREPRTTLEAVVYHVRRSLQRRMHPITSDQGSLTR